LSDSFLKFILKVLLKKMSKVIESSGQVINSQNFSEGSCKNQFGCSQKVRQKTMLYWAIKVQISMK